MKIYTNDLVKGHSDFKVKCLTFGLYTQVSDSGPLGPLVSVSFRFQFGSCCALSLKNWLLKQAKIKEFVIFGQFLDIQLTN